jgi:oxygen-independent coproporphyrinogen-3 oxidase
MLGLYLHVPFCSAICNYCNFNRGLMDASLAQRYVRALEQEIRRGGDGAGADTVFFGGGTPSLLDPPDIARLIDACRDSFAVTPDPEITLEVNPETVSDRRLAGYRDAGVNRLSLGVQSFRDDELRRLGRIHDAGRAREAVAVARMEGFRDISLDLMMWLPQQRIAEWQESVEALIDVGPDHASLYLLELYPNAPLREDMARAGWSQAPDDDAADMYVWAMERLEQAGLAQYEISNVAAPGHRSRHNLKYWTDGEWLGFGCGAHSTRNGARWKNLASTEQYIARLDEGRSPIVEHRVLTADEAVGEALFTGLRLTEGADIRRVEQKYGIAVYGRYGPALARYKEAGLVLYDGGRLRLTRAGMLLANEVMSVFV